MNVDDIVHAHAYDSGAVGEDIAHAVDDGGEGDGDISMSIFTSCFPMTRTKMIGKHNMRHQDQKQQSLTKQGGNGTSCHTFPFTRPTLFQRTPKCHPPNGNGRFSGKRRPFLVHIVRSRVLHIVI